MILDIKDIVELVDAPLHTEETICYLDTKISVYRLRFLKVYPQERPTTKYNFIEHFPATDKGIWTSYSFVDYALQS